MPQMNSSIIRHSSYLICIFQILLQSCLLLASFLHISIIWRMLTAESQVHAHSINYTHPPQSCRINSESVTSASLCERKITMRTKSKSVQSTVHP